MKIKWGLWQIFGVVTFFGLTGPVNAASSYLKCGLSEVAKDGTSQSLYINACSAVSGGVASVRFRPDGDDFPYVTPSFDANIENGVLNMTLRPYSEALQLGQFPDSAEFSRTVRAGDIQLNCTVTVDPHYSNGVDVCH